MADLPAWMERFLTGGVSAVVDGQKGESNPKPEQTPPTPTPQDKEAFYTSGGFSITQDHILMATAVVLVVATVIFIARK